MTCTDVPVRFRLLDANVGWDPYSTTGEGRWAPGRDGSAPVFLGFDDVYGLRLNNRDEPRINSEVISPFIPPAWLAPGCRPCEWFLCSVKDPDRSAEATILHRDPCYEGWVDLRTRLADCGLLNRPIAVASGHHRLAVIDSDDDKRQRVFIWSMPDGRLAGSFDFSANDRPNAVTFASWRELIVSVERDQANGKTQWVRRYDLAGRFRGEMQIESRGIVARQPLTRFRIARDGALWAAEGNEPGPFDLWRVTLARELSAANCEPHQHFVIAKLTDTEFHHGAMGKLRDAFLQTSLLTVGDNYFCLEESSGTGATNGRCFAFTGELLLQQPPEKTLPTSNPPSGVAETEAIDSYISRCEWHRIRIDAELPANTSYTIEVATNESSELRPHEADWQPPAENVNDLLIDQPPGRFLFVRLRLVGTHNTTPAIRRVRIDFPRVTSLDQLPAVYRDHTEAEDFTERFLSLFDAATEDLDRAVERFPALLDPDGVPNEVLNWLGTLLGVEFDSDWDSELRRQLLKSAPRLYRKRGTVAGLVEAIKLIFGAEPMIDEWAFHRTWGVLSRNARTGALRLFGKSESRFRVGRSALGVAPLRSFGNPNHDSAQADAHRFTVLMPPTRALRQFGVERLNRLIENQKPAHAQHRLRIGGKGFIIGRRSAVGIDTKLVPTAPPVLGGGSIPPDVPGNIYLSRGSILRPGPRRPMRGLRIGIASTVGVQTFLE